MRKSKGEYIIEALKLILDYLHSHKIQARALAISIGVSLMMISFSYGIKMSADSLVIIIQAFR